MLHAREPWRGAAGYDSLWKYCLGELHLREGAAGRRIGAMRVLREFPALEGPLRDGSLSLTTAVTLRPVLTRENLDEVVARAAYKSDEETRHLVATLLPRPAPREGIRKLPEPVARVSLPEPEGARTAKAVTSDATQPPALVLRSPSRPSLDPVSEDRWSMRVTVDRALREDLETLKSLLSHTISSENLTEVFREAVRCAIERHGKRKGAVKPERTRKPAESRPRAPGKRGPVPAHVKRAVWERDGGRCSYVSPDGHRCESRRQLEYDHVEPDALGGRPTVDNVRLRCRPHNTLHAEETFGRKHMARFRRKARPGTPPGATIAGDSAHIVNSVAVAKTR